MLFLTNTKVNGLEPWSWVWFHFKSFFTWSATHTTIWKLVLWDGFDNRNLAVGFGHWVSTGKNDRAWSSSRERACEPGFSLAAQSSTLRPENFPPRAPQYGSTSSRSLQGLHNHADQHCGPFSPWTVLSGTARFPDENCLFWIRLNLVSWILLGMESFPYPWPTFCGTKYPFTVSPSTL